MKVADNKMIEMARSGDGKATEDLIEALDPLIKKSIRSYYYRPGDFEDLAQEGRVEILKALESFDPTRGIHFLGYIKVKLKYFYLEKNKKEKRCLSLDWEGEEGQSLVDSLEADGDIEKDLVFSEDLKRLKDAMKTLTPREREVVMGYFYQGRSMVDLAKSLNIAYRTVVNTKTRAIEKLKDKFIGKMS